MKDPFEEIAQETIRKAEAVECSLETFAEGLDTIRIEVSERLSMVRSEINHRNDE